MLAKLTMTFLTSIILSASVVFAGSTKIIRYEDFLTFGQKEQIETIKLVHEFLIEFESLSLKDRRKKTTQNKFKTYKKILNFFIQSAYAQDSTQLTLDVPTKVKRKLCYYAGWLSYSNKSGYCTHPKNIAYIKDQIVSDVGAEGAKYFLALKDKYKQSVDQSKFKKIEYKKNGTDDYKFTLTESNKCNTDQDIICNPNIYGSVDGKEPFCVPGNRQRGLNSSLMCSEAGKALKNEQNGEQKYKALMKQIAQNAVSNDSGEDFFYTLRAMYDSCLCAGGPKDATNEAGKIFAESVAYRYANRIFYSRTCYGIINQTENIYEAFHANKKDVICPKTQNLSLGVNGEGPGSMPWNKFLTKVNNVIKDQEIDLKIEKDMEYLRKTFNKSYTKETVKAENTRDKREFAAIRKEHFTKYQNERLCPIADDDSVGYELIASLVKSDDPQTTIDAYVDFFGDQIKDVTIKAVDPDGKELTIKTHNKNKTTFNVTKTNKSYEVTVSAVVDGNELVDQVTVPGLKGPSISISTAPAAGDEAKTHTLVTIKVLGAPVGNADAKIISDDKLESLDLELVDAAVGELPVKEGDGTVEKTYKAKRLETAYSVKGIAKLKDDTELESGAQEIAALKDDDAAKKECSAKLAVVEGESGPKLDLSFTYDGKSYPDGDTLAPDGDKVKTSIKWYDAIAPEAAEEVKPEKAENTVSQLKTADDKDKDETEDKKELTEEEKKIADIKENLKPVEGYDNDLSFFFPEGAQKRSLGAILSFAENGKVTCTVSATQEVDATDNSPKFDNNNPVKSPQSPSRARGRGRFLGGQN